MAICVRGHAQPVLLQAGVRPIPHLGLHVMIVALNVRGHPVLLHIIPHASGHLGIANGPRTVEEVRVLGQAQTVARRLSK